MTNDMPSKNHSAPFALLAGSVRAGDPSRAAIAAATRRPEPDCLPSLLTEASFPPEVTDQAQALARRLVLALRGKSGGGGVEGLIQEFSLSSQEGIALLCLAEALLRIPDSPTRDALIRDKLADKPGKTIFVRADARAQYLAVENAIDAVRTAGVDDVGLLTQKRESAASPGGE